MKKLSAILTTVVCLLTLVFTFSACGNKEPKIEGKYYLQSLMYNDSNGGYSIAAVINMRTEYDCVVGGEFDFSKFYLEFKDGKMIKHGSWEVTAGPNYMFVLSPDSVTEYSYELKESESIKGYYQVYLNDIGSTEPYCSFSPAKKYNSASIFRQYVYGLNSGVITCNYYLEGSAELNK